MYSYFYKYLCVSALVTIANFYISGSGHLIKPGMSFQIQKINSRYAGDTGINQNKISSDTLQLISDQFSFTEGPAVDKEGNVFFTDQPNNKIWEYDINRKLSLFMDSAGRSNGLYFDTKGNIISCADEHNQLWLISPQKKVTVLVNNIGGEILNGPNDVWVNPLNGDISVS